GDAVPDRLSDGGEAAGLGRGDAGVAAPGAARVAPEPHPLRARDRRAGGDPVVGRHDPPVGRARVRSHLGRASGERRGQSRGSLKVAILAPAWFAVPPTGYGGIEWIVSLLADGLVDAGHDVTLFASGDS